LKYIKYISIATLLVALSFSSCDITGADDTDPENQNIDLLGVWESNDNSDLFFAVGVIENEEVNTIILCDGSETGLGCLIGSVRNDTIQFDNLSNVDFIAEKAGSNIKIKTLLNLDSRFSGIFTKSEWPEGKCGLFYKADGIIGLEDECIVGEWYTKIKDPYGGPYELVYKTYFPDGSGEYIYPEKDNIRITFSWSTRTSGNSILLREVNYSDTSLPDVEYAFLCTDQGLALGTSGGSWIRKNIVCLID